MTGIVAALKADDGVCLLGQDINDLALAFVSPLRAENYYIGHVMLLEEPGTRPA
jgi:hypothetical protein